MSISFGADLIVKDNVQYDIDEEERLIVVDGGMDELVGYLIGFFSCKMLQHSIRFTFLRTGYNYFDQDDEGESNER
jgi:hypothetical protein